MGLFDKIFGRNKAAGQRVAENKEGKDIGYLPVIWEDDYCQIEIVPRKNVQHIETTCKEIEKFTEKTRTAYGFTDMFMREGLPFPTLNEELRIDYFEKIMLQKGFEKVAQIRYEVQTIINCSKTTSNAFTLSSFTFFYDCKDEFINNIWLTTSLITSQDHFDTLAALLYELGTACALVLIDWNGGELIDLTNQKHIERYLMGYWK